MECGCEDAKLFPVCDTTGKVYFSPCHAGCRKANVIDLASYNLVIFLNFQLMKKICKFRNFPIVIVFQIRLSKKNFAKMIVN